MHEKEIIVRFRISGWPRRNWLLAAITACVGLSAVAYAALPNPPFTKGEVLSSGKINGNFQQLDTRLSKLERPILFCTHTDELPAGNGPQHSTFSAADCGGTAPDGNYRGSLVAFNGCNGFLNIDIAPGNNGLNYVPWAGVGADCIQPGKTTTPYQIKALFFPK